jgi:hypothetical protein
MFIFQPYCFALASQPATIFFARSGLIAGLVSAAIPAEQQMTKQVASATGPRTRLNISISTPYVDRDLSSKKTSRSMRFSARPKLHWEMPSF